VGCRAAPRYRKASAVVPPSSSATAIATSSLRARPRTGLSPSQVVMVCGRSGSGPEGTDRLRGHLDRALVAQCRGRRVAADAGEVDLQDQVALQDDGDVLRRLVHVPVPVRSETAQPVAPGRRSGLLLRVQPGRVLGVGEDQRMGARVYRAELTR